MRRILGALSLAALAACPYRPTPVPLQGDAGSIAALRGDWSGEYWGNASERRGSLSFTISATADSAFGDVIMLTPQGQQIRPIDTGDRHRLHAASAQALRIDFVRIGAGMISGTLEPYVAPDCNCEVSTTFTGNVVGDTIRGTFITNGRQGGNRDGMWMMTRRTRGASLMGRPSGLRRRASWGAALMGRIGAARLAYGRPQNSVVRP